MSTVPGNRLRALLSRFDKARLVVIGDLVADEFIYGQIDRVSREAPVLILKYDSTEIVPGGAGNAAANAAALGADVQVIGAVGNDDAGERLLNVLGRNVDVRGVLRAKKGVTTVKTRILAGGVHSAKQQVVRIDRAGLPVTAAMAQQVESLVARAIRKAGKVRDSVWRLTLEKLDREVPQGRFEISVCAGFHCGSFFTSPVRCEFF